MEMPYLMPTMTTIATKQPDAVKDVALERLPAVTNELKAISRVQMISPTTKSMEHLMNNGLTTSLAISQIPKASFVAGAAEAMTAPVAAQVHANATNTVIRNREYPRKLAPDTAGNRLASDRWRRSGRPANIGHAAASSPTGTGPQHPEPLW